MGGLPECKDWAFICEMQAFFAGGFLPGFWVLSDLSADLFFNYSSNQILWKQV
jgi:hypothetical protein